MMSPQLAMRAALLRLDMLLRAEHSQKDEPSDFAVLQE